MKKDIKRTVTYYRNKFGTNNPFEIADRMGILYQMGVMECSGCYMFLKNHRYIFLNEDLPEHEKSLVMAHELAHAILHRKENCYFIRNKTLLSVDKNEIEANLFAIHLLVPDDMLNEYYGFTVEQIARALGYHRKLIELRMK